MGNPTHLKRQNWQSIPADYVTINQRGCQRQPDDCRQLDGILKEDISCLGKKSIFPNCSMQ
jgi:hypothetical protein